MYKGIKINSTGDVSRDIEIKGSYNYSGSGLGSFNNFSQWPSIQARIPMPAGREDLRDKLANKIVELVNSFIEENDLLNDQTVRTRENTREEVWAEYGLEE